ncbi:P-loop containing nucleoside triphosphate hydrolase protein [Gyrodon lividus]|nr:P-loop containing nucleoside triphosphate hydrolase protein [Gyrodon lividus]
MATATQLCGSSSGHFDFSDACTRASWSALLPSALVAVLCMFSLRVPLPSIFHNFATCVRAPLHAFLTLHEAEALDEAVHRAESVLNDDQLLAVDGAFPLRWNGLLTFIALVQVLACFASGMYSLITGNDDSWIAITTIFVGLTWVYGLCKPTFWPKPTAHLDLFALYVIHLLLAVLLIGGTIYEYEILHVPMPPGLQLFRMAVNLVAVVAGLAVVITMPFELPSVRVKKSLYIKYSPEDYATIVEWLTFSWVYPLIKRGTDTAMNEDDVWDLSPTLQSRPVFSKFNTITRSTLLRCLFAASSSDLLCDFLLTVVSVMFNYASPYFLRHILESIDNPSPEGRSQAYIYAFLAFFCALVKAVADAQHLWYGRRAATRLRVVFMAAIYDKALKRQDYSGVVDQAKAKVIADEKSGPPASETRNSDDPKAGADVGKIVNLMAVDANKVSMMVSGAHVIYGSPLEIIIASTFLYNLLGLSAFAGFVVLLAAWPLNSYVARRNIRIQKGVSASRDKRMAVLSELINAVKFIKFFAWEERWIGRVMDARNVELKWVTKARINSVIFSAIWISAPIMVSLISFFVYVYQGNKLTVSVAFTAISLFAMIRQPLNIIPSWIIQVLQAGVALKRIETFLNEGEVTKQVSSIKNSAVSTDAIQEHEGLAIKNGSFKWNIVSENKAAYSTAAQYCKSGSVSQGDVLDDRTIGLRDISVRFPEGKLSLITGPTASGKTALLLALLGEMTITSGKLIMSKDTFKVDKDGNTHSISYVAQSPWLRQQSIKENIIFGYPYDEVRYNAVIECCMLRPDLNILEDGDATEVGARGVSLSGGQKARVALARAVYARTKYVLLDDPLSALDSHTARFLSESLLSGPLLANRTVVLVTHHVELVLPSAHYLIRMFNGRIDTQGTVKDLHIRGVLDRMLPGSSAEIDKREESAKPPTFSAEAVVAPDSAGREPSKASVKKLRRLIAEEHREHGGVKWLTYNAYLKASSYWTWVTLSVLVVCSQSLAVADKLWIRKWVQAYGSRAVISPYVSVPSTFTENGGLIPTPLIPFHDAHGYSTMYHVRSSLLPDANEEPLFYVAIWGLIGLVFIVVSLLSTSVQYSGALRASRSLFQQLLRNVVHGTMRWHDVTPQGRMLNRFGKDIETIDSNLGSSLAAVNSSLAAFAGAILTIAIFFPLFLIPAVVLGFFYYRLVICYLRTGRDLRRMESNSRSPIFSGFAELLEGIVTVRAFSAERRFMDDLYHKIDITTKMWYNFWMINRWLLLNFDALGSLAILTTTLFALSGYVGAGTAGLCITSAMTFTNSVYWACRFWTTLELDLNSVERVVEYLGIPQEPPSIVESNRPPAYWPSSTSSRPLVSVENLVLKYSEGLPPVIHNVSFALNARERVGLLGRTGCGKSTLAMSFLRFVEPAAGRITIDGIDISQIGIYDLRSRLTFIPQDATLFSGTLRENLDPFNDHEDSECLDVLYRVQMLSENAYHSQQRFTTDDGISSGSSTTTTETISDSRFSITLDTQISAGGSNFSQGQRQLIAMARALLRRSSIVILDEATSSIDFETDAKIQATIREEFKGSLLLTVAHRLRTVIDYDRLIVLNEGKVAEFDTPLNLIRKEHGIFRTMCLQSGMFTELEAAAQAKAEHDP